MIDRVARLETLTRMGFAARGVMYLLIAWAALHLGRAATGAEVLASLASGSGRLLLGLMALGFLAYGLWRLAEAALDAEGQGRDAKGLVKRSAGGVSGLIHLGLAYTAARLASGRGNDSGESAERGAAMALDLPGGPWLLMLAAVILLAVGIAQLIKAAKADFLRRLAPQAAARDWVRWSGRAGYAARALVFLAMAPLLWRAGRNADAAAAGGPDEALASLPGWIGPAVALGLGLFGLFSLAEARWRRITDPAVLARLGRR